MEISFEEVWKKTDAVCGCFLKEEARVLYEAAMCVPRGGVVVELGCLFGRSTTVLAEVAKKKRFHVWTVDCFAIESDGAREAFERNVLDVQTRVTLIEGTTKGVGDTWSMPINMLFIDADHQENSVHEDCETWIKHVVRPRGIVAFHDYFNSDFPSVKKWADHYTGDWSEVGMGGSLLVRQNEEG